MGMLKALLAALVLAAWSGAYVGAAEPGSIWKEAWVLMGPCCGDEGHDLVIDEDGTYFITGRYGAIDFDGDGQVDSHADGGNDPLIMKGRPEGDPEKGQLLWVRSARTPGTSFGAVRVAADRTGGAYMAGGFEERLELHSGDFVECRGDYDGFIARFDGEGEPLWVRSVGGDGSDIVIDIASDLDGNLYALAKVQGEVRLGRDGASGSNADPGRRHLLFSFDRDGDLRWQRLFGGSAESFIQLEVSRSGDVLITGYYTGGDIDLDSDGAADLPVASDVTRSYVAVFDSTGDRVLTWSAAGPEHVQLAYPAIAGNGDLIFLGAVSGSADLDADGSYDLEVPAGEPTLALSRFDAAGSLLWARTYNTLPIPVIMHITAGDERIVLAGHYKGPLDWDGDGTPEAMADDDGKSEGLIVVLDKDGDLEHLLTIVGQDSDQVRASGLSPDGKTVWATGFLRQLVDFDGDGRPEGGIRCDHYGDIFGARYTLGD